MKDPKQIEYWQSRPVHERFEEACRLTCGKYGVDRDKPMDKTIVHRFPSPKGRKAFHKGDFFRRHNRWGSPHSDGHPVKSMLTAVARPMMPFDLVASVQATWLWARVRAIFGKLGGLVGFHAWPLHRCNN
jgi:hypothetical protein